MPVVMEIHEFERVAISKMGFFWRSRKITIATQETSSITIKSSRLPKNQRLTCCSYNSISGYGGLVVEIDGKMSKSLAVVWHF